MLAIKDNIIKTFEVPSTLRTDLCADEPAVTQPSEGATVRRDVDAQSFWKRLISYGVLNKIKSLKKRLYEPYLRITSSTKEELENAPIQAAYLFNYYSQDREEPSFLQNKIF